MSFCLKDGEKQFNAAIKAGPTWFNDNMTVRY